ncbi:hypothetical protein TSUD_173420 [Trifolium subterraneum]|nr:hypothetical protein TSUD_173420 [Trifolium subterraneum]
MATISTCLTITPTSRLLTFTSSSSTFHKPLTKPFLPLPYNRRIINRRNWVSVVPRAAVDLGRDIRPGGAVETDKLPTDVRKRTMDAVDGFGGRVSEEGDILYVFPKDYRSKLGAKSFRIKAEPYFEKAKNAGEYVIRVSFGTTLIASIVIVFTAIIAILSSSKSDDDRGERRRSSSYGSGFNFFFSPSDLFWYWDPYYSRKRRVQDDNKFNFIESVFSFVFGDGDPNQGIEEERWKLIGQYISSNGGVVAAEELAPYLDIESTEKIKDDESYMLPVLLRFDGQPVVDEEGNILYRFPSLQKTASQKSRRKEYVGKRWADWVGGVEKFFEEKRWQFSKTSSSERALVVGLGGLNLFGVIVLGTMLKDVPVTVRTDGFIKFVTDIFPLLQIYAGSFFAIPLVRWFLIRKRNSDIEKRNKARQQWAKVLELPDISLTQKLFSARDMAQKTVIGKDQIVYSTDKDFIEQDYEVDEWDKKFRELERSD